MKTRPIKHEADSIVAFFDKLESNGAGSLAKQKGPPRLIEQGFKASPSLVAYAKDSMRKQRDGAIARQIEAREEQLDNAISGEGFILDVILSHALTRGDRIRAAIWAAPDQSDVTFYEAEQVDEGRWRCAVMCKDHDNRSGCYNIHVYIEGDQGATLQRIGCFERMVICPKGIPAEHQDANPTTLPAQDMKVLSIATRPIAPGLADDPSRPDTLRSRIGRMLRRH